MAKAIARVALAVLLAVALLSVPVAADDKKDDIACEDFSHDGITHTEAVSVIEYSDVSNAELWNDAREFAADSLEKCDLQGREETELAGEVRAHALGEDAPGDLNPGATIDMAGYGHDPQEDEFGWLMGGYIPPWISIPGSSTS